MPKIKDIEPTPNPNAMKFILREPLTAAGSRSYDRPSDAEGDALAEQLFAIEHVVSVFYMDRFLTVTKDPFGSWDELLPLLAAPIREAPSVSEQAAPLAAAAVASGGSAVDSYSDDPELLDRINAVLDDKIRPGLAGDGGGLQIISLHDRTLTIRYQGACGSCPSSIAGTLMAIEQFLKQDVDPELEVVAV
ncbi:MAG TPA: NifU family protein [Blastocatellia bacterium]|nr:NifU family protein [Blastocatellia bacterium]